MTSSLLSNSSSQWKAVVTTGTFLKILELLQLEIKAATVQLLRQKDTQARKKRTTSLTVFLTTRGLNTEHLVKMLCSHGLQSALSPAMDFSWPASRLWPEVRPLLYQQDLLQRNLQELQLSLELMNKLQHNILERTEPFQSCAAVKPVFSYRLEKEGEGFGLTLDTQGFSPEELSVRQVSRRLRVSGKTEKKQEQKGCSSYTLQEFRQEFDLPEGLNPEAVSCYLDPDGKLHIQAAKAPCVEEAERELTVERSLEEKTQQSVCPHTGGSNNTDTHNSTQEKPENMDSN